MSYEFFWNKPEYFQESNLRHPKKVNPAVKVAGFM